MLKLGSISKTNDYLKTLIAERNSRTLATGNLEMRQSSQQTISKIEINAIPEEDIEFPITSDTEETKENINDNIKARPSQFEQSKTEDQESRDTDKNSKASEICIVIFF